ncbi:hypothetical protein [Pseudomonas sp. URMO17WK12:I11]|uniref:hypothetical protein n=1 Tax=Pseudomonas sp. URMO17WK12:I11 TaxID=1283291 RepID=UPI00119D29B2|nr:hypothetical protein [Pseudomonas sp. URMO17WK12:I11]
MQKQRSWGDCGVVALLNALQDNGVNFYQGPGGYENLVSQLNGRDCGITIQEVCAALFQHGFLPVHLPLDGFGVASGIGDAATCKVKHLEDTFFRDWPKAIYQVKSKSGLLHFVYFDGDLIWDGAPSAPVYPEFSDYESIIDVVYVLPNTPFSIYRNTEEITEFSEAHLKRHQEWIDSKPDENSKTVAQLIAEYEADKKSTEYASMTDEETGITLRIHRSGLTSNRKGLMGEGL